MRSIGLPTSYGHVEETPDLEIIIEIETYEPDLQPEDEILPEHIKHDEMDDRELERQRNEYFDSINSPVLPPYKPK